MKCLDEIVKYIKENKQTFIKLLHRYVYKDILYNHEEKVYAYTFRQHILQAMIDITDDSDSEFV
jgi:hypothetical protein